jgi:integrase
MEAVPFEELLIMILDPNSPSPITWGELTARLAETYAPPFKRPSTWSAYRLAIETMAERCSFPCFVDEVVIASIVRDMLDRGRRKSTVNSRLRVCRAICNIMVRKRYLATSPFDGSRLMLRVMPHERLKKAFSARDMIAVLDQADMEFEQSSLAAKWSPSADRDRELFSAQRLRALVYLVGYTGMRAREALYLRCADVDVEVRTVTITGQDRPTKTLASAAPVPLPAEALVVVANWRDLQVRRGRTFLFAGPRKDCAWDNALKQYRPSNRVKALAERAGVVGMTLAHLRHTFCTLVKTTWGLNPEETRQILRHTSIDTQAHYTHGDVAHLVARVDGFSYRRATG